MAKKVETVTRSEVRSATIDAVRQAKSDPRGLKLSPGQRLHIVSPRVKVKRATPTSG